MHRLTRNLDIGILTLLTPYLCYSPHYFHFRQALALSHIHPVRVIRRFR